MKWPVKLLHLTKWAATPVNAVVSWFTGSLPLVGRASCLVPGRCDRPGWTRVTWDGRSAAGVKAAPGAYVARLVVEGRVFTRPVRFVH